MVGIDPGVDVILITAHYSTDSAVEAIQKGACDYLTKPLDVEKLRSRIANLMQEADARRMTLHLDQKLVDACQFEGMVARSPLMLDVFARILRVAPHFRTLLVTGAHRYRKRTGCPCTPPPESCAGWPIRGLQLCSAGGEPSRERVCSAMSGAPSRAPFKTKPACSSMQKVEQFSWMRLANSLGRHRQIVACAAKPPSAKSRVSNNAQH